MRGWVLGAYIVLGTDRKKEMQCLFSALEGPSPTPTGDLTLFDL